MIIIRKIENRCFELVEITEDRTYGTMEHTLSKLFPSTENKTQYTGLCYGNYERFKSVKEWKNWCIKNYGMGSKK